MTARDFPAAIRAAGVQLFVTNWGAVLALFGDPARPHTSGSYPWKALTGGHGFRSDWAGELGLSSRDFRLVANAAFLRVGEKGSANYDLKPADFGTIWAVRGEMEAMALGTWREPPVPAPVAGPAVPS